MVINTVIIEDEQAARENLKTILNEYCSNINLLGEADSVEKSIKLISDTQPELLIMDVEIIGGTAFDILKQIEFKKFKIIFTTAFNKFAIDAIKFSAFDYLLKPYKVSEMIAAIQRVQEYGLEKEYSLKFEAMLNNFGNSLPEKKKIVLKTLEKIHIVSISDILYCKSENNYTLFFLANQTKVMVSKPIKLYEELLGEYNFIRVHQSFLVNLNHITQFDKSEGGYIIIDNGEQVPVSQRQKNSLLEIFNSL